MYSGFQDCLNWNHKLVERSSDCFKQKHLHSVDHFFIIEVLPPRSILILFSSFENKKTNICCRSYYVMNV